MNIAQPKQAEALAQWVHVVQWYEDGGRTRCMEVFAVEEAARTFAHSKPIGASAWVTTVAVRGDAYVQAVADGGATPAKVSGPAPNHAVNAAFLQVTDAETRAEILRNIAQHYGITAQAAHAEVTRSGAEHLLDYLTGSMPCAVRVLMQRRGFPV